MMGLINRMMLWQKLLVIVVILSVPGNYLVYLLVVEKDRDIGLVQNEIAGTKYLDPVQSLQQHVMEHRGMTNALLSGDSSFRDKLQAKRAEITQDLAAIAEMEKRHGATFHTISQWNKVRADWHDLESRLHNISRAESFARHSDTIKHIIALIARIGDTSNLVFDTERDSYYLVRAVVEKIPVMLEALGVLRGRSAGIAANKSLTDEARLELVIMEEKVRIQTQAVQSDIENAIRNNPELEVLLSGYIDALQQKVRQFTGLVEKEIISSGHSGAITAGAEEIFTSGTGAINAALQLNAEVVPVLETLLETRINRLQGEKYSALAKVFACLLLVLLIIFFISRTFIRNIDGIISVIRQLSKGNLTVNIYQNSNGDEVSRLYNSLYHMRLRLTEVIKGIRTGAATVGVASKQVAEGNANLSQRTQEQASSLEEVASSMEEMTSTVSQNADNAQQASQLASGARAHAERGGEMMDKVVVAMEGINTAARKIVDIIGVIDGIAFQTNLLALNAAVEAARAGEQGRGFAVVASEVRNLAGRCKTAAKEIKVLVEDSVEKVEGGAKLVDESGRVLEDIMRSVQKVNDIVAEIAAASREQAEGIEQVNKALLQMDEMTQQNATLVDQAAAASEATEEQAEELNALVEYFRLNESDEVTGVWYLKPVQSLQQHVMEHRGMTNAFLSGDTGFRDKLQAKRREIIQDLETIALMEKRYGTILQTREQWRAVQTGWETLQGQLDIINREESFIRHTSIISDILALIARVGDTSHLIFDQSRDSYYLMDTVVRKMPAALEALGVLRGRSAGIVAQKDLTGRARNELAMMLKTVQEEASATRTNIEEAINNNPDLRDLLRKYLEVFLAKTQRFAKKVEKEILDTGRTGMIKAGAQEIFSAGTEAIHAALVLNAEVMPALEGLILNRTNDKHHRSMVASLPYAARQTSDERKPGLQSALVFKGAA